WRVTRLDGQGLLELPARLIDPIRVKAQQELRLTNVTPDRIGFGADRLRVRRFRFGHAALLREDASQVGLTDRGQPEVDGSAVTVLGVREAAERGIRDPAVVVQLRDAGMSLTL